jgi:hypothetical protein
LRTVTFAIDPANTEDIKLKVCDIDSAICVQLDGRYWFYEDKTELKTVMRNTRSDRLRYFAIALPKGSYTGTFLDADEETIWPTFVHEIYEDAICSDVLLDGSVELDVPLVEESDCDELIRNGNAEASDSDALYWLHRKGGIALDTTQGRNGSHALIDMERTDRKRDAISQYLDTRCLMANQGSLYEISAFVKLVDPTSGDPYFCDIDTERCPQVGIFAYSPNGSLSEEPIATVTADSNTVGGYQLVQRVLEISEEMASASSVLFYIERNRENLAMLVDDVSMKRIVRATTSIHLRIS